MAIRMEQDGYCSKQTSPKPAVGASAQEQMAPHQEICIRDKKWVNNSFQPLLGEVESQLTSLGHWAGEEERSEILTPS